MTAKPLTICGSSQSTGKSERAVLGSTRKLMMYRARTSALAVLIAGTASVACLIPISIGFHEVSYAVLNDPVRRIVVDRYGAIGDWCTVVTVAVAGSYNLPPQWRPDAELVAFEAATSR